MRPKLSRQELDAITDEDIGELVGLPTVEPTWFREVERKDTGRVFRNSGYMTWEHRWFMSTGVWPSLTE